MAETIIETEKHVKTLSRPLLSKKNKESVDLYIKEIEPLIDSTDEKKAFNDILLSSSSILKEKLMPVDP